MITPEIVSGLESYFNLQVRQEGTQADLYKLATCLLFIWLPVKGGNSWNLINCRIIKVLNENKHDQSFNFSLQLKKKILLDDFNGRSIKMIFSCQLR